MVKHTIKELREDCAITRKELANDLNIPYTSYLQYESGQTNMPAYVFSAICDYFNISRDDVIIPNCKQAYKKKLAMGNRHPNVNYEYRRGFIDGKEAGQKEMGDKIIKTIKGEKL